MKPQPCLFIAAALLAACTATAPDTADLQEAISDGWTRPRAEDALFLGAGDIARCGRQLTDARTTGDLIRGFLESFKDARVFTAGDNAYEEGTTAQFADCYEPAWGSFNGQTLPSPGNHDYRTLPPPYFAYYRNDPAAKSRGYYSLDLKDWHIVSLNSNITMDEASPQVQWLESDLASTDHPCILAFWHHPLFSSGEHGAESGDAGRRTGPLWEVLERHGADVIVNGHDHHYERFAPQDRNGTATPAGIRQFIAGTGGARLRDVLTPLRKNSEFHNDERHGILALTLRPGSFGWAFFDTDGDVADHSEAPVACH